MNRLLYFLIAFFGTSSLLRSTYSPVFVPVQAQFGASMAASLSSSLNILFILVSAALVISLILVVDLNNLVVDSD
jgi:hypothetical protein